MSTERDDEDFALSQLPEDDFDALKAFEADPEVAEALDALDSAPEPGEPDEPVVTLRVTHPAECSAWERKDEDGGTLVVTRHGSEVPAHAAPDLIELAALSGVTLAEVSN